MVNQQIPGRHPNPPMTGFGFRMVAYFVAYIVFCSVLTHLG